MSPLFWLNVNKRGRNEIKEGNMRDVKVTRKESCGVNTQ